MAERISQDNFDTKILQAEGVAVADFYSDSCVPCKRISPLLADLEEAHDNVYVGKVNIAYDRDLQKNTRWHLHRRLSFSKMEQK